MRPGVELSGQLGLFTIPQPARVENSASLEPSTEHNAAALLAEEGWIVHVPSTLPDEEHPCNGLFSQAHIQSAALFVSAQVVYYAYSLSSATLENLNRRERVIVETNRERRSYPKIIRRYKRGTGWQLRAFVDFLTWAIAHRRKIKVLHAHGTVWGGIWCAFTGRLLGIPVVVSEHESAFPRKKLPWFIKKLVRVSLPLVQTLTPVTNDLANYVGPFAPSVPRVVVPNCIDTDVFKTSPSPATDNLLRILFVGAFVSVKRIDLALRACACLKATRPLRLRLVGIGPLLEPMRELVAKLGLSEEVEFLGLLSAEQVHEEMANCHFLLLTSSWETQSRVAIEAMLTGRPVVAPRIGGIPETVLEGKCGVLFKEGSEDDLVSAMETVARQLSYYDPEVIASYSRARFSYHQVGHSLARLYDGLASS